MIDIEAVAKISRAYKLPLVVSSTFTPSCTFRPIGHGTNIVVDSLTKWIGGHGTVLGGIIVDADKIDDLVKRSN